MQIHGLLNKSVRRSMLNFSTVKCIFTSVVLNAKWTNNDSYEFEWMRKGDNVAITIIIITITKETQKVFGEVLTSLYSYFTNVK